MAHPNGTVTAYTYNTLNRLTNLATTRPASGQTIQSYGFTLGPAGNRTAITESDGTVRAYTYDSLYRLTGERVNVGVPLQYEKVFTYDDVGNRLTQVTTGSGAPGTPLAPGSRAYGYDTRDRLLTETLGANPPTSFGYDANGNLITKSSEATYTWDFENRLIRVATGPVGTITLTEHAYDADGNRVQTKVTPPTGPPTVTNYLVDTSGALSHVVAETDGVAALKAYYVRADDLLAVMRPLVPVPAAPEDWQTRFVHADGIGSIRRLTNEAGAITDGYTYTAFGELIAHTGTDPQPYAFAGEPYDPNSGFQYHRARWMDAGTGRFVGMDPFEGRVFDPPSLHRYLYTADNPANRVHPSGQDWNLPTVLTVVNIVSVIATTALDYAQGGSKGAIEGLLMTGALTLVGGAFLSAGAKLARALILSGRAVRRFKTFNRWNLAHNLEVLTGIKPLLAQAHHVFPQAFRAQFKAIGLAIDDPLFGAWWEKGVHQRLSSAYGKEWRIFLQEAPRTIDELLEFGREHRCSLWTHDLLLTTSIGRRSISWLLPMLAAWLESIQRIHSIHLPR